MENNNVNFIDTHCHLDLYKSSIDIIKEAEKAGVILVAVTNTPSVFYFTENLSTKYNNLIPAIGLHPELAIQRKNELALMWDILPRTKFVGEIGLDYSSADQSERKVQREVFSQIIQHCFDISNKVLTIHSRRSAVDVISIVGNSFPGKIIMHWFTGTQSQAERAVLNGYYFSFNSSMLNSRNGQLLAKIIPREKILTETDGPFITIDDEPVRPGYIPQTVSKMAELLNVEKDELQKKIFENFQTLVAIENGYAE